MRPAAFRLKAERRGNFKRGEANGNRWLERGDEADSLDSRALPPLKRAKARPEAGVRSASAPRERRCGRRIESACGIEIIRSSRQLAAAAARVYCDAMSEPTTRELAARMAAMEDGLDARIEHIVARRECDASIRAAKESAEASRKRTEALKREKENFLNKLYGALVAVFVVSFLLIMVALLGSPR